MTNEERERLIDEACQRAIAEGKKIVRNPETGATVCICPLQALCGSGHGYTARAAEALDTHIYWAYDFEDSFDNGTDVAGSEAATIGVKFAEKYL